MDEPPNAGGPPHFLSPVSGLLREEDREGGGGSRASQGRTALCQEKMDRDGSLRNGYVRICLLLASLLILNQSKAIETQHLRMGKQNLWATLAERLNQTHVCLAMTAAGDPFRSCMIGVPMTPQELLTELQSYINPSQVSFECKASEDTYCACTCDSVSKERKWPFYKAACLLTSIVSALHQIPQDPPEEIDLLWAVPPGIKQNVTQFEGCSNTGRPMDFVNGTGMIAFDGAAYYQSITPGRPPWEQYTNVTGNDLWHADIRTRPAYIDLKILTPRALPPGVFLICENRAFTGIPWRPVGGPCYIGKLVFLNLDTVNMTVVQDLIKKRVRRDIALPADCNDKVELSSTTAIVFASWLMPGVQAGINADQIRRLACWARNQINITASVLADIAMDVRGVRRAVLQNRAAIDYLLAIHNHGCDELEGLCCFNLSDHSDSVVSKLKRLTQNLQKIQIQTDPVADWFNSLGLPAWLLHMFQPVLMILVMCILMCLFGPCCFQCIQNVAFKTSEQLFKRKGGDVVQRLVFAKDYGIGTR